MAAQQPSRVLDAQVALHCRLEEVSADRSEDDRSTETEHLGDGEKLAAILVEDKERREHAGDDPGGEALPRLPGRDHGRHAMAAEGSSDEIRRGVGGEHREQDRDHHPEAVIRNDA